MVCWLRVTSVVLLRSALAVLMSASAHVSEPPRAMDAGRPVWAALWVIVIGLSPFLSNPLECARIDAHRPVSHGGTS
ncbi:hypothetical protein G6F30_014396 [Rhizopus arrhizus]|nr:hypothetical protein G6F30_014396 [Rhizopus arrhizus]